MGMIRILRRTLNINLYYRTMSSAQIVTKIIEYVASNGGSYSDWYAGIASDPKDRLFNSHGVQEHSGVWIYAPADSSQAARDAEQHLISRLGTDGGPGGGDLSTTWVYAYKKTYGTKP